MYFMVPPCVTLGDGGEKDYNTNASKYLDTAGVTGSNPVAPTIFSA